MKEENLLKKYKNKIWFFDDLTLDEQEYAEENYGCESGNAYLGDDPIDEYQIPFCPFCKQILWNPEKGWDYLSCSHLVFVFDMNDGYVYEDEEFCNYFWEHIYPENIDELDRVYVPEEIEEIRKCNKLPYALEFIPNIKIVGIYSNSGDRGREYGFVQSD